MASGRPILSAIELYKHFGGLVAVDRISLEVRPGEVVGLLGDNGAGKSTLIKMISGVYRPDSGRLMLNGQDASFSSPQDARNAGVETIYQDLALCENLDAGANIFLGREPVRPVLGVLRAVDRARMLDESKRILAQLDIRIPALARPISQMSGGQRQAVAIARAVYWNARLMIMDEPTAALGVPEQRKVLALVRTLRERGVGVILISHNLQDVLDVADRVIVMRRGRAVGERWVADTDTSDLVGLMIGADGRQAAV
ncbi:MAG: ATP-binding cassette domain-containing protein [Chloroflexota bacterium]|nr:ATP-binding cassette domain-containing protein [Chloroflexota bacterium]